MASDKTEKNKKGKPRELLVPGCIGVNVVQSISVLLVSHSNVLPRVCRYVHVLAGRVARTGITR